jgi:hypothetical protein
MEEEVLEKNRRILGDEHLDTLKAMHNLASTYWAQGKTAEAAAMEEEVLEKSRRILGDDHPDTLVARLAEPLCKYIIWASPTHVHRQYYHISALHYLPRNRL